MTPYSSRRRTTRSAALLLAMALGLTACGGSDPKAADDPTESATVSETPSPTPTPTATPTAEPLSPFEGKPPVKATRVWATALAKAINARERSLSSMRSLTTTRGFDTTRTIAEEDLSHGWLLPGPEPFTPVSVQVRGAVAKVNICLQYYGWSVSRKTGKPVHKRAVGAAVYELHKVGGAWKFDNYYAGTADCAGVRVRGVRW